jgi:hypothetical protein
MIETAHDHASRTSVIETLAGLLGFHGQELHYLPDGARPDVLRFDVHGRGLFVGDAKHTESPGSVATALRFRRYMRWIRAHQRAPTAGVAIVVLCFGRRREATRWLDLIEALGADVGAPSARRTSIDEFDADCHLVFLEYGAPPTARATASQAARGPYPPGT